MNEARRTRTLHKLSARTLASITRPGRHSDGGGLYLAISKDGRRRWVFMWTRAGKQREAGLGSPLFVSLAEARAKAVEYRRAVERGEDPIAAKRAARTAAARRQTFGEVAVALIKTKIHEWRNPKSEEQWRRTLLGPACAPLRDRAIDEIEVRDVLAALGSIWTKTPVTAARVRGRIEAVFDFATGLGLRPAGPNPAAWKGNLQALLPRRKRVARAHHPALPYAEVPAWFAEIRRAPRMATRCLEFICLTACRAGEATGATWDEIDLDARVWGIPPHRMKSGKGHRVPLADEAVEILKWAAAAERCLDDEGLVFSGRLAGRPLTGLGRFMPAGSTVHGLRSSFRDWTGNETHYPRELAEQALSHVAGDSVELAYRRSDALERRRTLMQAWATFCAGRSIS